MLNFMRNKLVGVEKQDDDTYVARGFLDDHIYSLKMEITIKGPEMRISGIDGQMLRYTTPDCHRAAAFLPEALGLCLNQEDFTQQVHKIVGRKACRHFANLMLECCDCVQKAAKLDEARPDQPAAGSETASQDAAVAQVVPPAAAEKPVNLDQQADYQQLPDALQGFFIDLHVHTYPASPCSSAPVEDLIAEAKRIGLDGICLTDHNHLWDPSAAAELGRKHGLLVLRGNEITTAQGDMVVFGLEQDVQGIVTLEELRRMVDSQGGFIIAAHPFRGFLTVGVDELGLEVDRVKQRPMFRLVDALETLNSKVTPAENSFSGQVAQDLGLPATGGSDAHQVDEVGLNATRFNKVIRNESELVAALRSGQYSPVQYRKMRQES